MESTIDSIDDPRLAPYRDMRHKNWIERSGWFIAEGPLLVERLLHSGYRCHSVLLDRKYYDRFRPLIGPDVPVLLCDHALIESLVGFNFHRGVLACGIRPPLPTTEQAFASMPCSPADTLVALYGIQDPENVGGILRSCAAMGAGHVLIGRGCADPLSRRALRVSMGNALKLNLMRSLDLALDLIWLHETLGVTTYAATLTPRARPLESVGRDGPVCLVLGNERHGLPASIEDACRESVCIAMADGVDSLNVCVAAGILMHYFCRIATRPSGSL
ncbi:MAG: RNA methyltransferase [Planctomycetota bacterium]|nr:MAG: RNA methyltransferase [Planctomycetota bacterium]